jgi:hypothetical protein
MLSTRCGQEKDDSSHYNKITWAITSFSCQEFHSVKNNNKFFI